MTHSITATGSCWKLAEKMILSSSTMADRYRMTRAIAFETGKPATEAQRCPEGNPLGETEVSQRSAEKLEQPYQEVFFDDSTGFLCVALWWTLKLNAIAPLDSERALTVAGILNRMALQYRTAIIIVTHDEKIIPACKRIYRIRDDRTQQGAGEERPL